jgi:hypothetical protein
VLSVSVVDTLFLLFDFLTVTVCRFSPLISDFIMAGYISEVQLIHQFDPEVVFFCTASLHLEQAYVDYMFYLQYGPFGASEPHCLWEVFDRVMWVAIMLEGHPHYPFDVAMMGVCECAWRLVAKIGQRLNVITAPEYAGSVPTVMNPYHMTGDDSEGSSFASISISFMDSDDVDSLGDFGDLGYSLQ